jgi:lambda family phage portal protein
MSVLRKIRSFFAPQHQPSDQARWRFPALARDQGSTLNTRDAARLLAARNPWAANGISAWQTALVGYGITPSIRNQTLADAWPAFVASADADGRTDFYGLQAQVVRAMVIDGESFVQLTENMDGPKLRIIQGGLVDATYSVDSSAGNRIEQGIEFNSEGQRLAYHLTQDNGSSLRVPADQMLHVFRQDYPGQVRGVSWLTPIISTLKDHGALNDALLIGAKISAMHAGFITDINGTGSIPYEGQQSGNVLDSGLEPGTLKVLPSGMDIKFNSPQQLLQTNEFSKLQLRAMAAGLGLPEFLLSGDMSQANYSSLRSALVSFRQRVEQVQWHTIIPQLLNPVWNRFALHQALQGNIETDEIVTPDWLPPSMPWVDPAKDAEAVASQIASGLMSRRQAVAALGYDIEKLDAEIAADLAREKSLGLQFVNTVSTENVETKSKRKSK